MSWNLKDKIFINRFPYLSKSTWYVLLLLGYITVELAFRSQLMEAMGSVLHPQQITYVEFAGRFIASIGLIILLYPTMKKKFKKEFLFMKDGKRRIILGIISTMIFLLFFQAQAWMTGYVAESLSVESKRRAVLLVNYRDSLYYGHRSSQIAPYKVKDRGMTDNQIFLAFLPILNLNNEPLIDKLYWDSRPLIRNVMESRMRDFAYINNELYEEVAEQFKEAKSQLVGAHNGYQVFLNQMPEIRKKKNKLMRLLKAKHMELKWTWGSDISFREYLRSDAARAEVARRANIGRVHSDDLYYCFRKFEWDVNRFEDLPSVMKKCTYELARLSIQKVLDERGLPYDPDAQLVLRDGRVEEVLNQPMLVPAIEQIAPYLIDQHGNMVSLDLISTVEGARQLSPQLAQNQMLRINQIVNNPEIVLTSELHRNIANNYAKAMVIPPIVVGVSTLMIALNIIKLLMVFTGDAFDKRNRHRGLDRRTLLIIYTMMIAWTLHFPLMLYNGYEFSGYFDKLKEKSPQTSQLMINTVKWTQNTSRMMDFISHKDSPYQEIMDTFMVIKIISDRSNIPILGDGDEITRSMRIAVAKAHFNSKLKNQND